MYVSSAHTMKVEVKDNHDIKWPESKERNCDYFLNVIWPLLETGHEIELYTWLQEQCLLRRTGICPTKSCGRNMNWMKARVRDKFNWQCSFNGCFGRLPIRHGSFFRNIHCEIKKALEVVLGWCERQSIEECCYHLDLLPKVVSRIYKQCIGVAAEHVSSHPEEWLLGAPGGVVVVDVFPSVYMGPNFLAKTSPTEPRPKRILCIADLKCLPPRVWMSLLDEKAEDSKKEKKENKEIKERSEDIIVSPPAKRRRSGTKSQADREEKGVGAVLAHLAQVVLPGTKVVGSSRWVPIQPLQRLTGLSGISVESLVALDQPDTKCVLNNLREIWKTTTEICEEAQGLPKKDARYYILEYMWRQVHGSSTSSALESILRHIAVHYSTNTKIENDILFNE